MKKVSLEEIAGGVLQEQFGKAFERVVDNLADPNTSFKEARKITITLKFTQNEQRDDVACDVLVTEKLAAQAATRTAFAVGKNLRTGEMFAEEYGRNQMSIGDLNVDTDTGEVLDEQPQNPKVIDMRKVNFN